MITSRRFQKILKFQNYTLPGSFSTMVQGGNEKLARNEGNGEDSKRELGERRKLKG
jgi:hypothetical protein